MINLTVKRLFLLLLCFFVGQWVILWSADRVEDVDVSSDQKSRTIIREEVIDGAANSMPARSDMRKQLEMMEQGDVEYGYDFDVDRIVRDKGDPRQYAIKNELPMILWWTPFTGDMGSVKRCGQDECFLTQDRSLFGHKLNEVMLFYGTSFNESDLPLPRKANHEWAVLHEESPKNIAYFYHEEFISLFNHTSTFKQESDYPITTQYINSLKELAKEPVLSFAEKDKLPLASVIYLQSGCNPPSDRDAYIFELMKYIKVDSYGACLNNKELPEHLKSPLTMHDDALREFVGQYKFALTFENAICDDYITEKLWRPLAAGAVPVYKGAPNVRHWLPDNSSVILVDDFKSPQDLARHLNEIASNEREYNKYLDFKRSGIRNQKLLTTLKTREWGVNDFSKISFVTGFECFICNRMHKNRKALTAGRDRLQFIASSKHYGCPKPRVYDYASPPRTEYWERDSWLVEYDEAKHQAKYLRSVVFK